jgi:hypothetical protein
MSTSQKTIMILVTVVVALMSFVAGVFVGVFSQGRLQDVTQNIDLSDWINLSIIVLLSVALWLALRAKSGKGAD